MERSLKFMKLDNLLIKPYILKSIILMIGLSILMSTSTKNIMTIPGVLFIYATIIVSYPFVIGEKSNIDKFYGSLAMKREDMVKGRYLFLLAIGFTTIILCFAIIFSEKSIMNKNIDNMEIVFSTVFGFFIYSILSSIQIPIYFKLGYTKAKTYTLLPFFLLGLLAPIFSMLSKNTNLKNFFMSVSSNIENHTILTCIILILTSLLFLQVSLIVSTNIYKKKDF